MMDHPNIARVLDAGATETGRPYFVMDTRLWRQDYRLLRSKSPRDGSPPVLVHSELSRDSARASKGSHSS